MVLAATMGEFKINGRPVALSEAKLPYSSKRATPKFDLLSEREREVFEMVTRGHTSQAIADKLFLSAKTVESYRARLMAKLGLQNRAELTQFALDLGYVDTSFLRACGQGHQR